MNAEALAKVAQLAAENQRLTTECRRLTGIEWQYETVCDDYSNALDELRRLNGTLEVVSAVDRVMPLDEEDVA